jgi:osmotically-inducible protein OsmY
MSSFIRTLMAAMAGAAAAYLLDPVSGRGRRARLMDQAAARARRSVDEAERRARYEVGRMKGAVHEAGPARDFPRDDAELLQKVRSEAVGPSRVTASDIEIQVEDGEVVLRGASRDLDAESDLVHRIEEVTGVRRVRNELADA